MNKSQHQQQLILLDYLFTLNNELPTHSKAVENKLNIKPMEKNKVKQAPNTTHKELDLTIILDLLKDILQVERMNNQLLKDICTSLNRR